MAQKPKTKEVLQRQKKKKKKGWIPALQLKVVRKERCKKLLSKGQEEFTLEG